MTGIETPGRRKNLTERKTEADHICGIEYEAVLTGKVRGTGHLGNHRLPFTPAPAGKKCGTDYRIVREYLLGGETPAVCEQRNPRPRSRPARGTINLTVSKHGDVALPRPVRGGIQLIKENRAVHPREPVIRVLGELV